MKNVAGRSHVVFQGKKGCSDFEVVAVERYVGDAWQLVELQVVENRKLVFTTDAAQYGAVHVARLIEAGIEVKDP